MKLEAKLQNRLLGITPSHEQQLHYAAIFRVSPELSYSTAYIDGWLAASNLHTIIIEKNMTRFGSDPHIQYNPETIENDKLQFLAEFDGTDLETTVANAIDTQFIIKNVIAAGGTVLLLTPDSDIPQQLTFETP